MNACGNRQPIDRDRLIGTGRLPLPVFDAEGEPRLVIRDDAQGIGNIGFCSRQSNDRIFNRGGESHPNIVNGCEGRNTELTRFADWHFQRVGVLVYADQHGMLGLGQLSDDHIAGCRDFAAQRNRVLGIGVSAHVDTDIPANAVLAGALIDTDGRQVAGCGQRVNAGSCGDNDMVGGQIGLDRDDVVAAFCVHH